MSAQPGANGAPPPPNPVLSAYATFVKDTPLVTRYTLMTLASSWFMSFIFDPTMAISNMPFFTVYKLELYRIVLSPLVCPSLITLVFAFISFTDNGKRLELSMGSTALLTLMATISTVTNLIFLVLCMICYKATGDQSFLVSASSGIWTILLALIAIECTSAPPGTKRKLFVFEIPTLYYPIAILVLFSLFSGGPNLAYILSVLVGYAYGYGYLYKLKISQSRMSGWEGGCLANFTRREGWVVGTAATGGAAWLPTTNPGSPGSSRFGGVGGGGGASEGGALAAPGEVQKPKGPAFPSKGGRSLGGATRRPASSDARAAMLEAAARRATDPGV
mmetsp:Transcript_14014/g.25338  ORF Transcript_14014/g.25338 Transcript_14014/m.25338 type:complete len:333 (-) Transcript_14014:2102-3100(-)